MKTFFLDNNSNNLMIFFLGWAFDSAPFAGFDFEDNDVLFVYDYSSLEFDRYCLDFSKYNRKTLIAFSYGVFMSALVREDLPNFDFSVVVNGTLKPIDKEFGINPKIFSLTLEHISDESMDKFYLKMFNNSSCSERFFANKPINIPSLNKKELSQIQKYFIETSNIYMDFDKIIIADNDKIIPTKSQLNYWGKDKVVILEDSGHFPFYKFEKISEICLI